MPVFYANPDPIFQPALRLITNITKAAQAVVTTSFDHDYISGVIIRFNIPRAYGMTELDSKTGIVTVLSDTTFSVDIDTREFNAFVNFDPTMGQWYEKNLAATTVPVGEVNSSLLSATRNVS